MDIELAQDDDAVDAALATLDGTVVGVDVERADGRRYFRVAALVQVGIDGHGVLLDPLALESLEALDRFLERRIAVFHAVDNDVDSIENAGVRLREVVDTQIAASLLGLPLGLDTLLEELLDVRVPGDKSRFQRADWTQRPLPDDMIAYAAGDVAHLPTLWYELEARLAVAGRLDWHHQEVDHTIRRARASRRSWTDTSGIGGLDGRGRAVLRAVWEARESIGRDQDLAPQVVARDDVLVAAGHDPPTDRGELEALGLRGDQLAHADKLLAGVQRGLRVPEEPRPGNRRETTQEDRATRNRMRKARAKVAREIGIDAGVLCPSRILTQAILADPERPEALCDAAGLRPWQRELLADELWDAYTG